MVLTQRLKQIDAANTAYYESRGKDFQSHWSQAMSIWEKDAAPLNALAHRDLP
jgi:zinc/manganese transport system substrate-binding protein